jgi:hypothetical protein
MLTIDQKTIFSIQPYFTTKLVTYCDTIPDMPWKDIEKQRAAIRKHYYANRKIYIDKAQKRRKELRAWFNKLKQSTPCADCKVNYPYYVMDFDHLQKKSQEVSKLINTGNAKRLKEEIALCELVCSNCHRIRTYNRIKGVML